MYQPYNDGDDVQVLHLAYHMGEHYNSVRSEKDPGNGPALDYPIGKNLVKKSVEDAKVEEKKEVDSIQWCLDLIGKKDRVIMKNVLKELFGDEDLDRDSLCMYKEQISEEFETFSLANSVTELDLEDLKA